MNNLIRSSLPDNSSNRARMSVFAGNTQKRRKTCVLPKKFENDPNRGCYKSLLNDSNDDIPGIIELDNEGNCQVSVLRQEFYEKKNTQWDKNVVEVDQEDFEISKEYIDIKQKTRYELVEEIIDEWPLLELRKCLLRIKYATTDLCKIIIENQGFEYFIILVIILNILILAMENPTDSNGVLDVIDQLFLIIYTVEAALKIIAMGFLFPNSAYLRDNWNKMDLIIVITGWLTTLSYNSVNLASFRTLRILRPLRSISSISGMRILFVALIKSSIPLLASLLVLFFFLLIFAIAGVQLWAGLFRNQCIDIDSGVYVGIVCGNYNCEVGQECVYSLDNPNYGVTNFDNIFSGVLSVFECITLEGWTDILIFSQKAFNDFVIFYYFPLVFIGNYLLLSITLAVIKNSFSKAIEEAKEELKSKPKQQKKLNLSKLKPNIHDLSPENSKENSIDNIPISQSIKPDNSSSLFLKNKGINTNIVSEIQYRFDFEVEQNDLEKSLSLSSPWEQDHSEIVVNTKEQPETQRETAGREPLEAVSPRSINVRAASYKSLRYTRTRNSGIAPFSNRFPTGIPDAYNLTGEISEFKFIITNEFQVSASSAADILPEDENQFFCDKMEKFVYSHQDLDPVESLQAKKRLILLNEFVIYGNEIAIFSQFSLKYNKKNAFLRFFMQPKQIIETVQLRDLMTQSTVGVWSGFDISKYKDHTNLINSLNQMRFQRKFQFLLSQIQYQLSRLTESKYFHLAMILCVLLNTVVLSIDYYGISSELSSALSTTNMCFTYIFLVEMMVKLLGKGLRKYFREYMNYFDAIVVILSIIELIFVSGEKSTLTAFRTVRIFRIFRVIRVARLFRYLQSMTLIMRVMSKSLSKFIYLALLLLLFLVIYTLLGLQVFKGQFNFKEGVPRSNYDNFHNSFISTFQVLSIENWQTILFSAMRSSAGVPGAILLISWIILGNYILLNLFLAILLEGFSSNHDEYNIIEEGKRDGRVSIRKTLFSNLEGRIRKKQEAKKKMMKELYYESEDSEVDSKLVRGTSMKKTLLDNIMCEKSYFFFSKSSEIRTFCYKLINSKYLDYFVMFIICCSTIKVAADTYLMDEPSDSQTVLIMIYLDICFTTLFAVEFIIKSIALGFVEGKSSYIRDIWNFFDFMIIIFSIIDLSVSNINLSVIKSIRILRTLRPLRFISHNLSMKIVVVALFDSLIAIFNVIIVLLIVWLMFAILGVSLLAGKLYRCSNSNITLKNECIESGYNWNSINPNYDNIINAISTLFILSSEEGWPDIMYQAIDSQGVDIAPERDSSPYLAYYFVVFILIGSFFFLNFFIGVVFDKFNWAKKNEMSTASLVLTKEQALWIEIQKLLLRTKPYAEVEKEKSTIRLICTKIYKNKAFELFIIIIIAINIVQMSMVYNEASTKYLSILENINLAITIVFIFEALIKIIGAGPSAYFYNNWNKFDFFVVATSLLDIILSFFIGSSTVLLRLGPQMFKLLRVLRISKIIRIFKALKKLETLVNIIAYSLPAILNVVSLMTLIFFIYSVLGVNLFHSIKTGKIISDYTNFNNFGKAMITLFRVSTGEDWYVIMYDCKNAVNLTVSAIFFMSFVTITTFVMLNFFIMVILQTYEDFEKNPFHIFKKFTHDIKNIKKIWAKYSDKNNIYCIHFRDLINLMKELTSDFGDYSQLDYDKMMKKMSAIEIEIDSFGFIFYNDFLFSILRVKYRKRIIGKEEAINKKIIQKEEQETLKKLARLREGVQHRIYSDDELKNLKDNKKMNFFLEILNVKTIFKTWKKWAKNRRNVLGNRSMSVTPQDSFIEYPGCVSLCTYKESGSESEDSDY